MNTDIAIKTDSLSKNYGHNTALNSLSLQVNRNEVVGFLGPNGAGKTTTIRLILGLIKPTSGQAEIFGINSQKNRFKAHKHLAYIPGESTFWPNLTGEETLYLLGKIQGQIDLKYQKELVKRFDFDVKKKIRTYSKGNRQKINIIAALQTRADLIIMDEPTTGLDPLMEQTFRECALEAKANGQTIFLSSHILEEVESICDRVGILREGKLIEYGTLEEMRHLSALTVEATFAGQPPKVDHVEGVSSVKISGHQLICQVHGAIEPLFKILIAGHPKTLLSREPSLEELFLSLYGENVVKYKVKNEES